MKLFINDKRVKFIADNENIKDRDFDFFINALDHIDLNALGGNVLISNASVNQIKSFLKILELKKLDSIKSFSFITKNVEELENEFKAEYKIIKAAGGVVIKNGKILMIHRLGLWDLPKGKLENGEPASEGAMREVEEECGVKTEVIDKICSTWHTYTAKDKKILKKTTWYLMNCINDSNMKPQQEENIDKVVWASKKEAKESMKTSYQSIRYVIKKYLELKPIHFS